MTIAITGASGQLGALILGQLQARAPADAIVALVRSPEKAAVEMNVDARRFDYDDIATLAPALSGVDTLMLVSSSEVGRRVAQHGNVITAAREAGVQRMVYTSVLHADTSPLSLADEHRATEALLEESGIAHTILRNGWYTENYTASVPPALANGGFIGSARDGRISSAARLDYAEAAAVVLTTDGHAGARYELAGDDSFTLAELAAELSQQTDRHIPYIDLPEGDFADALRSAGLPDGLATALAGYDVAAADGALFDDSRTLSALIGRPTTPLSASVRDAIPR